eukprot:118966_1
MRHNMVDLPLISWIGGVTNIICTISIIAAIIVNIHNTKTSNRSDTDLSNSKLKQILAIITNSAILLNLLHSISLTIMHFDLYPTDIIFCSWLNRINTFIYHCTRCSLYSLFILRVHISFQDSVYKYNVKLIIIPLFAIVIMWFIFAIMGDLFLEAIMGQYDTKTKMCEATFALYGILMSAFIDFMLSIISLTLFLRPLIKLNTVQNTYLSKSTCQSTNVSVHTVNSQKSNSISDNVNNVNNVNNSPKAFRSVAGIPIETPVPMPSMMELAVTQSVPTVTQT